MSISETGRVTSFRQYVPDLSTLRFVAMRGKDCHTYARDFKDHGQPAALYALYQHWLKLFQEPFKGVTNDGIVRSGLFDLHDENVPIEEIVRAVEVVIGFLDRKQLSKTQLHLDSPEWRSWSNPEFLLNDKGIRLDEVSTELADAVLGVLEASLSPEGYQKALGAMRINGFLGELVNAEGIMNARSYNFVLFVISPWFTGAEPNEIDSGQFAGTRILGKEEKLGLWLMQSLDTIQQEKALVYELLRDPKMPPGRWNPDDQRHLSGAYRDNRVVPYEGIRISYLNGDQMKLVESILNEFLLYLPAVARATRMSLIRQHYEETYFCWIGGFGDEDAFYYRIQSPVIIVEFDHHSGVFLSNKEPAKFHVHTLLRTPNGGDYGKALLPLIPGEGEIFSWNVGED